MEETWPVGLCVRLKNDDYGAPCELPLFIMMVISQTYDNRANKLANIVSKDPSGMERGETSFIASKSKVFSPAPEAASKWLRTTRHGFASVDSPGLPLAIGIV